jgi:hypothetical protein
MEIMTFEDVMYCNLVETTNIWEEPAAFTTRLKMGSRSPKNVGTYLHHHYLTSEINY